MPVDEPRRAAVATTNAAPLNRAIMLGEGQEVTIEEASGVAFAEASAQPAPPKGSRRGGARPWPWLLFAGWLGWQLGRAGGRSPVLPRGIARDRLTRS